MVKLGISFSLVKGVAAWLLKEGCCHVQQATTSLPTSSVLSFVSVAAAIGTADDRCLANVLQTPLATRRSDPDSMLLLWC
jgi:hypothetical protein